MRPFEQEAYLRDILKPAVETDIPPSLFERYALDPEDARQTGPGHAEAIAQRLDSVKHLWARLEQRNNPRYGQLCAKLLAEHRHFADTLNNPSERTRKAEEVLRAARESHDQAIRWLEDRAGKAKEQGGGVTPQVREWLTAEARKMGLSADEIAQRLSDVPTIPDASRTPLNPHTLQGFRNALKLLGDATGDPMRGLTAFHALRLSTSDVTRAEVDAACHTLEKEVGRYDYHSDERHAVNSIVSLVHSDILRDLHGVERYRAALREEVAEKLRRDVMDAALDNRIHRAEAEQLVRQARDL